jgi:hypothetical protein
MRPFHLELGKRKSFEAFRLFHSFMGNGVFTTVYANMNGK